MTWLRTVCAGVTAWALAACTSDASESEQGATAACDRDCLVALGHQVVSRARPLEGAVRFTENGMETKAADSWLARAKDVNIHGDYADADEGSVVVVGTGTDSDERPTVFGLRLQADAGKVSEAELILAHSGEASLFPAATPLMRLPVYAEETPMAARTPPERMVALANAYFDGIEVDSGTNVPVTEDCQRVENGVQTTNSERFPGLKCNSLEGFDYITEVRERRFPIVDEQRGVVVGLVAFYIPGGDYERTAADGTKMTRHYDPRALFLMEAFKIESGKIRMIEATMRNMPLGSTMGWPAR
ncbi:MAG TPA: hypothetical protein VJR89_43650 [Polyangiales bacterium]|nr:hypothetical protein [Polyangiales bacterium]